jgi:hypothetical protein
MEVLSKFLELAKSFFKTSVDLWNKSKTSLYRIEEICISKREIIFYGRDSRTIIKASFEEAINTPGIIFNLPPIHACWIGYYYGKALREGQLTPKNIGFLLRPSKKRYNIISLDHRNSIITYIDLKDRSEHTASIIELARNNEFLENIGPSQACYIGIWTGIEVAKHGSEILISKPSNVPHLRIVK